MRNKKLIFCLLVGSFVVALLYDLVDLDWQTKKSFFPFFHGYAGWDGKMSLANYVYGYCNTVVLLMLFMILYLETGRKIYQVCEVLCILDLIDYALRYNHTWFTVFGYGIELNHFAFITVLYFAHKEYGNTE